MTSLNQRKNRWQYRTEKIFRIFSIIDFLNLLFLLVISTLFISIFNKTPYRLVISIIYPALFFLILISAYLRNKITNLKHRRLLMLLYPIVFLFTMFESFFMILTYFNENRFDWLMAKIDFYIFNVNPTIWIEPFINPFCTEVFYWLYLFYFPMPLIALSCMYRKKMFAEIEYSIIAYYITYYGAYLSYFIIPVMGPRFYLEHLQTVPLNGLLFSEIIHDTINLMEPNKLDAFPSLHTAILLITMVISYKYVRKLYYLFFPIAIGILISLIYLRYHYFVDIIFGAIWAAISWILATVLFDKYRHKTIAHFGE